MKQHKEISVPLADQKKTLAKMKKDGWKQVSTGFAPEGPGHALMVFEREKTSKPAPKKPTPKKKPAPKTVARVSVPKKSAKKKGKK